ncbi:MAG TPA: hypothetical protein VFZ31_11075, partial [Vicinamibacterales bacterium]
MRLSTERAVLGVVMAISLITLGLQAFVLRPRLWPAGAGVTLSGGETFARWAAPSPFAVIRPPDVSGVLGEAIRVLQIVP